MKLKKILNGHKKAILDWVPPGHITQYEKMIKDCHTNMKLKNPKFYHKRNERLKKSGRPTFDDWFKEFVHSAYRLKNYMDFRAFHEKQKHEFDELFYFKGFQQGCFTFFGIACCRGCGEIINDNQNPTALEWFEEFEAEEIKEIKLKPTVH